MEKNEMTKEEAIKTIREARCTSPLRDALEYLIPELAESEDERMCKRCIELLRKVSAYSGEEYLGVEIADCIIWLQALRKKQKESLYIPETCKENSDSFTDEDGIRQMLIDHFTRYKIGNVSTKLNGFLIDDIIAFVKNQKIPNARQRLAEWSKTEEGKAKYEEVAKEMREEMEKEQKPEERFEEAREKYQVEWSEEDIENGSYISAFLQANCENNEILKKATTWFMSRFKSLCPLKQEQMPAEWSEEDMTMLNNLIWSVHMKSISPLDEMDDRGKYERYENFLSSLPKRFNLQPKQEWSEEDEEMLQGCINSVKYELLDNGMDDEVKTDPRIAWLKSLRPSWKPSEQEKGALRTAIHILTDERSFPKAATQLQNILDAFEGKESRKDWKPSNEQMGALYDSIEWEEERAEDVDFILKSLYNDLKKLM